MFKSIPAFSAYIIVSGHKILKCYKIYSAKFRVFYLENLENNAFWTHGGTKAETSPPFLDTSFTTEEFKCIYFSSGIINKDLIFF